VGQTWRNGGQPIGSLAAAATNGVGDGIEPPPAVSIGLPGTRGLIPESGLLRARLPVHRTNRMTFRGQSAGDRTPSKGRSCEPADIQDHQTGSADSPRYEYSPGAGPATEGS
jgi:hypothetical protein